MQIVEESPEYDCSVLNFAFRPNMLWTLSKQSGCVQNCLDESKLVWTYRTSSYSFRP